MCIRSIQEHSVSLQVQHFLPPILVEISAVVHFTAHERGQERTVPPIIAEMSIVVHFASRAHPRRCLVTTGDFPCCIHVGRNSGSFAVHDTGARRRRSAFHWAGTIPPGIRGAVQVLDTRTHSAGWPRSGHSKAACRRSVAEGEMAEIRSAN